MKISRFLSIIIVIIDRFSQLQIAETNTFFRLEHINKFKRQQRPPGKRFGLPNDSYKPGAVYGFTNPDFHIQNNVKLFNGTPTDEDLSKKYQVLYYLQKNEPKMSSQSTLVSSPFLFYKLQLPNNHYYHDVLGNLANMGAHLFPPNEEMTPEEPTAPPTGNPMQMMPNPQEKPQIDNYLVSWPQTFSQIPKVPANTIRDMQQINFFQNLQKTRNSENSLNINTDFRQGIPKELLVNKQNTKKEQNSEPQFDSLQAPFRPSQFAGYSQDSNEKTTKAEKTDPCKPQKYIFIRPSIQPVVAIFPSHS